MAGIPILLGPNTTSSPLSLLSLPTEIRLRIYQHLFTHLPTVVNVESAIPTEEDEDDCWVMQRIPNLSAQLIRTCRQIHLESHPLLYSTNTFDVSQREGLQLLLKTISPSSFKLITSFIVDWDSLTDFAWGLAKPEFVDFTSNVTTLGLKSWRMRVVGGTGFLYNDTRRADRHVCQTARDICRKATKLSIVAQRVYQRKSSAMVSGYGKGESVKEGRRGVDGADVGERRTSDAVPLQQVPAVADRHTVTTHRVKWRFLADEGQMEPDETVVDLDAELAVLTAGDKDPNKEHGIDLGMIDPA